ncbi:DUF4376 domain-containing protein [Rhizobium oryzihabitans]|uniref:DUF4376 domain-containing protein n=1 Tax=Rhizobium oryzihabitans TaxID=2267833 RepID=A0A7L5BG14_9HYPH|nr:DUF4376 domain-containing protein [Rhizobium oryzihabitans]QIB37844.1 DUF4376 domain-containing protein [Rhizobium oryzihabitans]
MTKFARIENGNVLEVITLPENIAAEDAFHPTLAAKFVACGKPVEAGWSYDGKAFKAPVEAAPTADELRTYAAMKRFAVETGGIVINSATIDTSRDSQSMIANAHSYIVSSGAPSTRFKALSGWITLSAAEVTSAALAVGAHVQASFNAEGAVNDLIASGASWT